MKDITTQIIAKLSIITIVITAFGIIINNIYLGQFNISDFNLLQSRSIFIGFIFSIFLFAHLVYYLALIDTKNLLENTSFEIFYKTAIKLILITNFLFYLLNLDYILSIRTDSSFIERMLLHTSFLSFVTILALFGTMYSVYKNDKNKLASKLIFKYPLIFLVTLSVISFFYNLFIFPEFKSLFYYELYFAFLFYINLTWLYLSKKDESKGIKFKEYSFFTNSGIDREFWVEKIFIFTYIIGMTVLFLSNYSTRIYPFLDEKYGGGKPKTIKIEYLKDQITGKLIYQDANKYYLLKDSTILFIKKEQVDKLFLEKTLHPTKNIVHLADSASNKDDSN